MFVQVIRGTVRDAAATKQLQQQWSKELRPAAIGFLGATGGVTDDGQFILVARFTNEADAAANSQRPEQDRWFSQMEQMFSDGPTFEESTDVLEDKPGDPDSARFVQVMIGRDRDPQRSAELWQQGSEKFAQFRPDILGNVTVQLPGNKYVMVIYFTNEEEARAGERSEIPAELRELMAEMNDLMDGVPEYLDLRDPWIISNTVDLTESQQTTGQQAR